MFALLTQASVLTFQFLLETDACGQGLGAVSAQSQDDGSVRSIPYASRTLQLHGKKTMV